MSFWRISSISPLSSILPYHPHLRDRHYRQFLSYNSVIIPSPLRPDNSDFSSLPDQSINEITSFYLSPRIFGKELQRSDCNLTIDNSYEVPSSPKVINFEKLFQSASVEKCEPAISRSLREIKLFLGRQNIANSSVLRCIQKIQYAAYLLRPILPLRYLQNYNEARAQFLRASQHTFRLN